MALRGTCTECGGTHKTYIAANMEWQDCPYCDERGNTILRAKPVPVASLAVAKFDKDTNPKNHSPRAALEKALLAYDEAPDDKKPDHIIVCVGWDYPDKEKHLSGTTFYQAGKYAHHGQMGLMFEAQHMIRESGEP